jgi:hypothetical protein
MAQEFRITQNTGVTLICSVTFNTEEPNTVRFIRDNDGLNVISVSNKEQVDLDFNDPEIAADEDGGFTISKNLNATITYTITCTTEVGLSEHFVFLQSTNDLILGFDDQRGFNVDFDDATVNVFFSV